MRTVLLPDWWDAQCDADDSLLNDVEFRVARFLRTPIENVKDPNTPLTVPADPRAQLKRSTSINRDRLSPSIHTATRVASAVVRNLRDAFPLPEIPPTNGLEWRDAIPVQSEAIQLLDIASDLWRRGIPIVLLDVLPSPTFQGIACVVDNRPIMLLGQKRDEPSRLAFWVAHEAGHIAYGDCAAGQSIIDGEDDVADETDVERRADQYATHVTVGSDPTPLTNIRHYQQLATRAAEIERSTNVDSGALIFNWARQSGDYATATKAAAALYKATGARRLLRDLFDRFVDSDGASDSDRALLRCVCGTMTHDAVVD